MRTSDVAVRFHFLKGEGLAVGKPIQVLCISSAASAYADWLTGCP